MGAVALIDECQYSHYEEYFFIFLIKAFAFQENDGFFGDRTNNYTIIEILMLNRMNELPRRFIRSFVYLINRACQ